MAGMAKSSRQRAAVTWAKATALLLALCICVGVRPSRAQATRTREQDVQALLELTRLVHRGRELLDTWKEGTDPCVDGWKGIICDCDASGRLQGDLDGVSVECDSDGARGDEMPVLGISIHPETTVVSTLQLAADITSWSEVGNLDELLYLDLQGHNLTGVLSPRFQRLAKLNTLLLAENRLTGTFPPYLGSFSRLSEVDFKANNMAGPIPEEWCKLSARIDVSFTQACGDLPSCLVGRPAVFTKGSFLTTEENGGICDPTPPECLPAQGCRVEVPAFVTNTTTFNFSFTAFQDTVSGIKLYEFSLGTQQSDPQGRTNVLPRIAYDERAQRAAGNVRNVTVPVVGGGAVRTVQYSGVVLLKEFSLVTDGSYFFTIWATNNAGPAQVTAQSVMFSVDATPPRAGEIWNTPHQRTQVSQGSLTTLGASWTAFETGLSGMASYSYQVFRIVSRDNSLNPAARSSPIVAERVSITELVNIGLNLSFVRTDLELVDADEYVISITGCNVAGVCMVTNAPTIVVRVEGDDSFLTPTVLASIVVVAVLVSGVLGAALSLFLLKNRLTKQAMLENQRKQEAKMMKSIMHELVDHRSSGSMMDPGMTLRRAQEFCFVITDLEGSTTQAAANPEAFKTVQEIHDQVMREGIARHSGYEINTEGDSFQVAFTKVSSAVLFCMETQYRLLETAWPAEVLRLPGCKEIRGFGGDIIFRGPRVRMGIHWAEEGTIATRLHTHTRHRIFAGPGFQVAQEVGDCAHGGQVLMTFDAWERLRQHMSDASFPSVEQLGLFELESWPHPMFLYQVSHLLSKPLPRCFTELPRGIKLRQLGWGLNIGVPPPANEEGHVTIVHTAIDPAVLCNYRLRLPAKAGRKLYELIAVQSLNFQGYIWKMHEGIGWYLLSFSRTVDAIRFCHSVQVVSLYTRWPDEMAPYMGRTVETADGRFLFRGPRLAMAVHETPLLDLDSPGLDAFVRSAKNYLVASAVSPDDVPTRTPHPHHPVLYAGPGEDILKLISARVHPGQVVLSETAWESVQAMISGRNQCISLGRHLLDPEHRHASMLMMEVMPSVLARRSFPPPKSLKMLEPGYRDAPKPDDNMAIVFVKVRKPSVMKEVECFANSQHNHDGAAMDADVEKRTVQHVQDYMMGVSTVVALCRQLLMKWGGYECKEPEPGKMTLAFCTLEGAVRWCAEVQKQLLHVDWPQGLLQWEDCCEVRNGSNSVIWRGLRVCMGVAYGKPASMKPLNTGRADYFGNLPNLAARVLALASPGQVLVEGTNNPFGSEYQWLREGTLAVLPMTTAPRPTSSSGSIGEETIELRQLGHYLLKGLDDPKLIYQAIPMSLAARRLGQPSTAIKVMVPLPKRGSKMSLGSSRASSAHPIRCFSSMLPRHLLAGSNSRPSSSRHMQPESSIDIFRWVWKARHLRSSSHVRSRRLRARRYGTSATSFGSCCPSASAGSRALRRPPMLDLGELDTSGTLEKEQAALNLCRHSAPASLSRTKSRMPELRRTRSCPTFSTPVLRPRRRSMPPAIPASSALASGRGVSRRGGQVVSFSMAHSPYRAGSGWARGEGGAPRSQLGVACTGKSFSHAPRVNWQLDNAPASDSADDFQHRAQEGRGVAADGRALEGACAQNSDGNNSFGGSLHPPGSPGGAAASGTAPGRGDSGGLEVQMAEGLVQRALSRASRGLGPPPMGPLLEEAALRPPPPKLPGAAPPRTADDITFDAVEAIRLLLWDQGYHPQLHLEVAVMTSDVLRMQEPGSRRGASGGGGGADARPEPAVGGGGAGAGGGVGASLSGCRSSSQWQVPWWCECVLRRKRAVAKPSSARWAGLPGPVDAEPMFDDLHLYQAVLKMAARSPSMSIGHSSHHLLNTGASGSATARWSVQAAAAGEPARLAGLEASPQAPAPADGSHPGMVPPTMSATQSPFTALQGSRSLAEADSSCRTSHVSGGGSVHCLPEPGSPLGQGGSLRLPVPPQAAGGAAWSSFFNTPPELQDRTLSAGNSSHCEPPPALHSRSHSLSPPTAALMVRATQAEVERQADSEPQSLYCSWPLASDMHAKLASGGSGSSAGAPASAGRADAVVASGDAGEGPPSRLYSSSPSGLPEQDTEISGSGLEYANREWLAGAAPDYLELQQGTGVISQSSGELDNGVTRFAQEIASLYNNNRRRMPGKRPPRTSRSCRQLTGQQSEEWAVSRRTSNARESLEFHPAPLSARPRGRSSLAYETSPLQGSSLQTGLSLPSRGVSMMEPDPLPLLDPRIDGTPAALSGTASSGSFPSAAQPPPLPLVRLPPRGGGPTGGRPAQGPGLDDLQRFTARGERPP